jgi:pilus assembly protein CpaB
VKRKRIGIVLVIIGVLVALGTGYFVYYTAQQAEELARQTPKVEVVVALVDLPERSPIPAPAVALALVPEGLVPVGAATRVDDVIGKFPLSAIYRNEVVNPAKLADSALKSGPAFALDPGMVAVTYPGSDLLSPTGALRPGDRIDLLLSLTLTTQQPAAPAGTGTGRQQGAQAGSLGAAVPIVSQTLLQNVEVLKVGNFPEIGAAETPAGKAVTFQVSHQDALILKWAKDSGGTIDLALRHPTDREPVETEPVNSSYIIDKYKFKASDLIIQ